MDYFWGQGGQVGLYFLLLAILAGNVVHQTEPFLSDLRRLAVVAHDDLQGLLTREHNLGRNLHNLHNPLQHSLDQELGHARTAALRIGQQGHQELAKVLVWQLRVWMRMCVLYQQVHYCQVLVGDLGWRCFYLCCELLGEVGYKLGEFRPAEASYVLCLEFYVLKYYLQGF